MFKIGFSKINLESSLRPIQSIREPIEAIAMYATFSEEKALWIVLDFMDFNRLVTDTIREKIIEKTQLSAEHIHILTTHNHGGGEPDLSRLSELCSELALDAVSKAKPAKMSYAKTYTDRQVNILRRVYIPEAEGTFTTYFGASEENQFNQSLFVEKVISELKEGRNFHHIGDTTSRPYKRFSEGDKEIFVVRFADDDDNTVGTIVRFAAHAVTANRPGSFSSDYPYYVRKTVEDSVGGVAMFMNGPCAEIAPGMYDKFQGMEKTLGEYIAKLALCAIKDKETEPVEYFLDKKFQIKIPVREEVLTEFVEIPEKMPDSLQERHQYLDKLGLKKTLPFLREKYSFGEKELSDKITVFLGALRFNDLTFAAFPGETFYATSKAFKSAFENQTVCTVTEHERTAMYMPPKDDFLLGGYETVCNLTGENAEETLLCGAVTAFSDVI